MYITPAEAKHVCVYSNTVDVWTPLTPCVFMCTCMCVFVVVCMHVCVGGGAHGDMTFVGMF